MLAEKTIVRIERFWAGHFGCSVAVLRDPGVRVLAGTRCETLFVFRYQESCLWHVHKDSVEATTAILEGQKSAEGAFDEAFIRATLGPALNRILGPCPLAYCDAQTFRRDAESGPCRQLDPADRAELDRLEMVCGAEAWEHGGVDGRFKLRPDTRPANKSRQKWRLLFAG